MLKYGNLIITKLVGFMVQHWHQNMQVWFLKSMWYLVSKYSTSKGCSIKCSNNTMRGATALPMFNVNGRKFVEHMSTYTVNITYPGNLPFLLIRWTICRYHKIALLIMLLNWNILFASYQFDNQNSNYIWGPFYYKGNAKC